MSRAKGGDAPRTEVGLRVAVLGAGNWGSTLANLIGRNGHRVRLWTRVERQRDEINHAHTNTRFVPGLVFPPNVSASTRLAEVLDGAAVIFFVVPAASFREVARAAGELLTPDQLVIHCTKGLEQRTHLRMSQVLLEESCAKQHGVLAGPNIAAELAAGKPAGTVIASHFPRVIEMGRRAVGSTQLMVFHGEDVVGVELSSAFKNVVAIAAGMATEMAVGENAKALLITRGIAEIARLAVALGAKPATFAGLAGIGDLIVTCASTQSRNHRVGAALARGEKLPDVLVRLGQVAEGVYTAVTTRELSEQQGIESPLLERVYRVLYEGLSPAEGLQELMGLPAGHDIGRFARHPEAGAEASP